MNETHQHEAPVGDSNSIIDVTGVNKSYRIGNIEVPILKNINMTIKEGEFLAIMGPSGSGKSTLMNLIGCLDRPTGGQIIMMGKAMRLNHFTLKIFFSLNSYLKYFFMQKFA